MALIYVDICANVCIFAARCHIQWHMVYGENAKQRLDTERGGTQMKKK